MSLTTAAAAGTVEGVETHRTAFVLFPGVLSLDVSGPYEVFAGADLALGGGAYPLMTVAAAAGPVPGEGGLGLVADRSFEEIGPHDVDLLVVPGGWGARAHRPDDPTVEFVRRIGACTARVVSVCTGAFLLAEAGLLDRRPVATHWAHADELADRHPGLRVDPEALWHGDGSIWTSAGVTAGIDLALHLVELDHGPELARTVARHLVLHLRRAGGQSQYAAPVWSDPPVADDVVRDTQRHIRSHPDADLGIAALAGRAAMSPRHFQRTFRREAGVTVGRYVERARVDAARHLFETEAPPLDHVVRRCGFGSAETMRRAFRRHLDTTPGEYRARFGPPSPSTRSLT